MAVEMPLAYTQDDITKDPCPDRLERASDDKIDDGAERDYGEISLAFTEIITPGGQYSDYEFMLDDENTPPGEIFPVLLKSIAGIENNTWQQYNDNDFTLRRQNRNGSCDFGLMQINAPAPLFAFVPSLRSSTLGNIAAGATVLAGKWNLGVPGQPMPIVNDIDPEQIIHWYYAFSSYNGGPIGENNVWVNNPNCGPAALQPSCGNANYLQSRQDGADWYNPDLNTSSFPYQERILYNLEYPRYPVSEVPQWQVGHLGLYPEATVINGTARNVGIRPDDELFLDRTANPIASLAPNILLFPHYPPTAFEGVSQQFLTFEFDLPMPADVTIDLLDANNDPIPNSKLVDDEAFPAGWSTVKRPIDIPIHAGYAYRIFAERGEREDVATWYVGQYTGAITISSVLPRYWKKYLPFIIVRGQELRVNLVRSGEFSHRSPLPGQATQPAYWQVQTIINTEDGLYNAPLANYTAIVDSRMRLRAAPRARQEIRQRINLLGQGEHRISFDVEVEGMPDSSKSQLEVRYRTLQPLGQGKVRWETLRTYTIEDNGTRTQNEVPVILSSSAIVLSFLATFDENDNESTVFRIDSVGVERTEVDCVPGEPCNQTINAMW